MSAFLSPIFGAASQVFSNQGIVGSGYLLYTYQAGTSTPEATWTDSTQAVSNSNPLVANSAGRFSNECWLQSGQVYKFILKDAIGNTIGTWDNITGINDTSGSLSGSEWINSLLTPTYISPSQFSVSGNQTAVFTNQRRIKLTVTAGTVYGYVVKSTFSINTTVTVSLDSGSVDSGISVAYYSILSSLNSSIPQQFQYYHNIEDPVFGAIGDNSTDSYSGILAALNTLPSGSTIDFGDLTKTYLVSQGLSVSGKDFYFIGQATIKYTGSGSPNAVLTVIDAPNIVEVGELYFDGGGHALNGVSVEANAVSNSKYILFNGTRGGNTAPDTISLSRAVVRAQATGGAASLIRPKNVIACGIKTYTCGTHGFLPTYCDHVYMYGGCIFANAANHGWEAVRCTDVIATQWHSEACGLSAGGVGDGTVGFEVFGFTSNKCSGDGSFTVEHNCNQGSVHDFQMTNCYKSLINVSYGSASNSLLNVKNVTVYNGYGSADISNSTTPGVNCYGSTGAGLSDNVKIYDVTVDGFNRGADYFFQNNGRCDVVLENPTGSGTYVIKGQLVTNCDIIGKCNYQVLDNAYQIISFSGTDSSNCRIVGQVLQAGSTSNKAVVTIDGAGLGFNVTANTGGALNYINVQAGAQVSLFNCVGNLAGTPWAGVCTPKASFNNQNNTMDFTDVGSARHFAATNNAGAPNFTNTIPPNATPYFSSGDRAFNQAYTMGSPREWAYNGAAWVSQGNYA